MKSLKYTAAAIALIAATPASAQQSATTIFLVDESGSMAGEQQFLQQFVLDLDPALAIAGVNTRNYGLLGFANSGSTQALIREFTIGGAQLGSAADFANAATNLVTSGSTEDGYAAIDYALNNYPISGPTTLVLVTDEDRDNTDSNLTFNTILADMQAAGANLVSMIDVTILNANQNVAIATDGTDALTQDGVVFANVPFDSFTGGDGSTIADYADLTLAVSKNGCVADLNQLRLGGDAAAAFAAAFQTCIVDSVTNPAIAAILTLPIRDTSLTVAQNIRLQLRTVALAMSANGTGGFFSSQGADVVDDMFGVAGLRGYGFVGASSGDVGGGDFSSRGFTVGMDYTTNMAGGMGRVGLALDYTKSDNSGDLFSIDAETRSALLYGVYRTTGGWQFTADAQFSNSEIDSARVSGVNTVTGESDGDYRSFGVEAGKRFDIAAANATVMPYLGLVHERVTQDGFTESDGGVVPEFEQTFTSARLGVRYEHSMPMGRGMVHTFIDAAWNRVLNQDLDIGTGTVALDIGDVDQDRFDLGVGLGFDAGQNSRFNINFNGSKSDDVEIGSVAIGFQMTF